MALAALWEELSQEQTENTGFVTPKKGLGYAQVTPKPAWIKAVTHATPVTPANDDGQGRSQKRAQKEFSFPKSHTPSDGGADHGSQQKSAECSKTQQQYHPLTAQSGDHAMAYHAHHFQCPQCIAAGRGAGYGGRCDVGLVLWDAYNG